jgi:hypothetical protein
MALTAANVRVGVTGVVYTGLTSATAPTTTGSATTGFTDLGYVSEDGVTVSQPDASDVTVIHAWQNNAAVRTIASVSGDVPTIGFTLIETSVPVLQLYHGVTVTSQTATDGTFIIDATATRSYASFIVDVVDGAQIKRVYVPYGLLTSTGDQVYANQEPVGFECTISAHRSPTLNYNMKVIDTGAHS